MKKVGFGRLSTAALISSMVLAGCGGRDADKVSDFTADVAPAPTVEVNNEAEALTLSDSTTILAAQTFDIEVWDADNTRSHFGANSTDLSGAVVDKAVIEKTSDVVSLDSAGDYIELTVDQATESIVLIYSAAETGTLSYSLLSLETGEWEEQPEKIVVRTTATFYDYAFINPGSDDEVLFADRQTNVGLAAGRQIRIMRNADDVNVNIDMVIENDDIMTLEVPFASRGLIEMEDPVLVTVLNATPNSCCGDAGQTTNAAPTPNFINNVVDAGDGGSFVVTEFLAGAERIVLNYVMGPEGAMGSFDLLIDGEEVGEFAVAPNSTDWTNLSAGADGDSIVDLAAPLELGQVVSVVHNGSTGANLDSVDVLGEPIPVRIEAEADITTLLNATPNSCCGDTAKTSNDAPTPNFVNNVVDAGDGFSVPAPVLTHRITLNYVMGPEGAMGSLDLMVDGDLAGTFAVAPNSTDWTNLSDGASGASVIDLDTPIQQGQVVSIVHNGSTGTNLDSVDFLTVPE